MEYKKKTIIWEDNNEPPKNYIWAKSDGKYYKWSAAENKWVLTDVSDAIDKKYDKPENGIPATDLSEDVQTLLTTQSDWNQTDDTKPDYIKNKPEISGGGSNVKVYDAVNDDGNGTFDLTLEDQINVYNDIVAGKVVYIKTVREEEGFDLIKYGMVVSANYHRESDDYPETYNIYVISDNSIVKVSTSDD